jgi:ribosome-binding factor A
MTRRTERINDLLREEISQLVLREMKDPRLGGLVTITEVDVSPDLRNAKVMVSVLGTDEESANTMRALRAASHFIVRELRKRLVIRRIPDLVFQRDTSIEEGARVLALLDDTAKPD